jgi:ankyrin repeat protein
MKGGDSNSKTLKMLIECGIDLKLSDEFCKKVFLIAAENGYTEFVCSLVAIGVCPDHSERYCERAALETAVNHGHQDIASILISRGVDPNFKNRGGMTALMYAALNGDL